MGFSDMFGDLVGFDEICSVRTGGKGVVSVNHRTNRSCSRAICYITRG
jgi:hypothetical protein